MTGLEKIREFVYSAARRCRTVGRENDGLSMIEVMVGALVLVIGALAIFKLVDAAARSSYRAEQSQVVNNLLQRELERVKAAEREDMKVSTDDPNGCIDHPAFIGRFGTGEYGVTFDGLTQDQPVDSSSAFEVCNSVPTGDVTATVYRMVTWYDPDIVGCEPPASASEAYDGAHCSMKRITIGAVPDETPSGGIREYREIQTDVVAFEAADPSA